MDVREILSGKSRLRRLKGAAKQMWARKSPEPRWRSSYPRGRPAATGRLLTTWTQSLFFENRPEHGAHSNEDEGGESNTGVHRASSRSLFTHAASAAIVRHDRVHRGGTRSPATARARRLPPWLPGCRVQRIPGFTSDERRMRPAPGRSRPMIRVVCGARGVAGGGSTRSADPAPQLQRTRGRHPSGGRSVRPCSARHIVHRLA